MSLEEVLAEKQARIAAMHRFVPGRTALLVVDMQRAFLEEGAALEVPAARGIIPVVAGLVEAAREASVPVVFTRYVSSEALPTLRSDPFGPEHLPAGPGEPTGFGRPSGNCLLGAEGPNSPALIPALEPRRDEPVVDGHAYDKFYGTCLDQALRARDIRFLAIAGILTEICVNATLLSAATREFRVTAVSDAMAALHPEIHCACLEIWKRKFARILTAAEVALELRGLVGRS